jgi:3-deoxy-D-manno-octulosonic-acid transferase
MFKAIYQLSSRILSFQAPSYLKKRIELGKEEPQRITERYGVASCDRPDSPVLWIHAASVGESRSVLALIQTLAEKHVNWHVLVTTGTVSSARIIMKELPSNALHQYLPLDVQPWVNAFLDHWQPNAVVWVEQEIWPNLLTEIHARKIPAILANGRLTESSFKRWMWLKSLAKELLAPFYSIYAQSSYDALRYAKLSGREVLAKGNLKYAGEELPYNPVLLDNLKSEIADRPVWLAASTHLGEEYLIAQAHKIILQERPDALLIIVPRHPDRGEQVQIDIDDYGLSVARRSLKDKIFTQTQVYIADTFSELGLFYRLVDIVLLGGSLVPIGGHNLIEPAQLGCAILYGPHMHKTLEIKELFEAHNASIPVTNSAELATKVLALMGDPDKTAALSAAANEIISKESKVLSDLVSDIEAILQ